MDRPRFAKHSLVAVAHSATRISVDVREHSVLTDQPQRAGGDDAAPSPLELLGASLAACVALYVNRFCASEGIRAEDLAVEVQPFWREGPGRIGRYAVKVHLPEEISPELRERLLEVAASCPVHATLTHAPEISVELHAPRPALVAS
jgi:putative redox protein